MSHKTKKVFSIDYTEKGGRSVSMEHIEARNAEEAEKVLRSWYVKDGIEKVTSTNERSNKNVF